MRKYHDIVQCCTKTLIFCILLLMSMTSIQAAELQIQHDPVLCILAGIPAKVTAEVTSEVPLKEARLYFKQQQEEFFYFSQMKQDDNTYSAMIPGPKPSVITLDYFFLFVDSEDNAVKSPLYSVVIEQEEAMCPQEKLPESPEKLEIFAEQEMSAELGFSGEHIEWRLTEEHQKTAYLSKAQEISKEFPIEEIPEEQEIETPKEQEVIEQPEEQEVEHQPEEQEVIEQPEEQEVIEQPEEQEVEHQPEEQEVIEQPEEQEVEHQPEEQEVIEQPEKQEVIEQPEEQEVIEQPEEQTTDNQKHKKFRFSKKTIIGLGAGAGAIAVIGAIAGGGGDGDGNIWDSVDGEAKNVTAELSKSPEIQTSCGTVVTNQLFVTNNSTADITIGTIEYEVKLTKDSPSGSCDAGRTGAFAPNLATVVSPGEITLIREWSNEVNPCSDCPYPTAQCVWESRYIVNTSAGSAVALSKFSVEGDLCGTSTSKSFEDTTRIRGDIEQ